MTFGFRRLWTAWPAELAFRATRWRGQDGASGVLASFDTNGRVSAQFRRKRITVPVTVPVATRLARRWPVILTAPAHSVLVRRQEVPVLPADDLCAALRHEVTRITPFTADALFWRWSVPAVGLRRGQMNVTLTMVPRMAVQPLLDRLELLGLPADFIETDMPAGAHLLPVRRKASLNVRLLTRVLGCASIGLGLVAILMPVARQSLALHQVERDIVALQPDFIEAEALRHRLAAGDALQQAWTRNAARTGDVLKHLATLTRALPDDTHLTNLVLEERRVVMNGQAGSAAHVMTLLLADPSIRKPAFVAPVMRSQDALGDTFMITASLAE